jgi:chromosome segregation ATPase
MTERTSQTKQILDKLESIDNRLSKVEVQLEGLKVQIEMQPKIDEKQFDSIKSENNACQKNFENKFSDHGRRIKQMEDNQTWLVRTVIVEVLGLVFLVIKLFIK